MDRGFFSDLLKDIFLCYHPHYSETLYDSFTAIRNDSDRLPLVRQGHFAVIHELANKYGIAQGKKKAPLGAFLRGERPVRPEVR